MPDVLATFEFKVIVVPLNVTEPEPFAVTVPPIVSFPLIAVNEIFPFAAVLIAPLVARMPLFVTAIFPVPVDEIPVTVNVDNVFVNETPPPPVLEALKLEVAFVPAPLNVSPPTDTVESNPLVLIAAVPVSLRVPLEFKVMLLALAAILPLTVTLPVLVTVIAPVPD
jgi:hypothetical protein